MMGRVYYRSNKELWIKVLLLKDTRARDVPYKASRARLKLRALRTIQVGARAKEDFGGLHHRLR